MGDDVLAVGDADIAHEWLQRALEVRIGENLLLLAEIKANFWREPALETPRFQALRDRIGAMDGI